MGIFDKIRGMVEPNDNDYDDFDEDELYGTQEKIQNAETINQGNYKMQQNPGYNVQQQNPYKPASNVNAAMSIPNDSSNGEIKVVKPEDQEEVLRIADFLMEGKTVVLNLEDTNKETARRLLDFLQGVAYAIGGQYKRASTTMYIISPKNVDVSSEQLKSSSKKREASDSSSTLF